MRGVVPARRGPFVSAKGPKTIFAHARPSGFLRRARRRIQNHWDKPTNTITVGPSNETQLENWAE